MNQKIQIRTIHDVNGNIYDIFDFMVKDGWGWWISKCTYDTLEDAQRWHKNVYIEDKRRK